MREGVMNTRIPYSIHVACVGSYRAIHYRTLTEISPEWTKSNSVAWSQRSRSSLQHQLSLS